MTSEFPRALLREKSHGWNLAGVAASPGISAQSVATYDRTDGGGFWTCRMTDVSLSGQARSGLAGRQRQRVSTLLWRAMRQICNGGVNPVIVPRNDAPFRPWPPGFLQSVGVDVPHGDDTIFDDGSGYYQPIIDVRAAAAPLRATSIEILIKFAGQLMGGESFSIHHPMMDWRLYEIATVDMTSETGATITFNPPLREAIVDDTQLEFDRPRCKMRLATPNAMDLTVAPWTFNSASVDFIESP
ncbi:hypothetical protein [Bradyrhizobium lablabi]|uniref:hypothetical protein n=1 Tax=Bradyrhizobium lablabi TaxID=722472 RepID=UPI001BAD2717|nr:hypothetical protein [Bradyrhizobium lablabi]MBR0695945.1 hypothetical protein [Bradyrhizobium lablabi]